MKCFGGGIQYIADVKEFILVRALGHIVEDSARQFIHEITSFQWDFTTETEGEQEERRTGMVIKIDLKDLDKVQDTSEALTKAADELNKAILRVMDLTEALRLETRGLGIEITGTTKEVN